MLFFAESTSGKYLIYIQLWRTMIFTVLLLISPISKIPVTDIIQSRKRILETVYDGDTKAPKSLLKAKVGGQTGPDVSGQVWNGCL